MNHKTAYLWGPLSSFTAPLAAWLINKGWHVHVATKSTLNFLTLSALDLASSARAYLEEALGGREGYRTFHDRLRFVDPSEHPRDTKYDALIFSGLPPNYDDARVPRAPWTADELPRVAKMLRGVPIFLVSSLWGAVQRDRVVPEELEFERRKPLSNWERICQSYETRLLKGLASIEANWYFVRIPMLSGATTTGEPFGFTGPSNLFRELDPQEQKAKDPDAFDQDFQGKSLKLLYNPDSTMWFLPVDVSVNMFWRFLEDETRPRICNFVSTQATLNREWLHHLGDALGLKEIVQAERDSLNLPAVLRRVLVDDVQVKTRNLFEVAGRYQLAPVHFDREYFDKVVHAGREKHWGQGNITLASPFQFSQRLASYYFEQFIPSQFTESLLRKATMGGTTIGFLLKDSGGMGWVLKSPNGKAVVERYERGGEKPRICFNFSGQTMTRLIQSKLPLHRALLLREVEVEGPLLDALRVTQVIDKFLKEHPMNTQELSLFQDEVAKS